MTIQVVCDACGSSLKAPAIAAGRKLACPTCETDVHVPAATNNGDREESPEEKPAGEESAEESEVYSISASSVVAPVRNACWNCGAEVEVGDLNCPQCEVAVTSGASLKPLSEENEPIPSRAAKKKKKRKKRKQPRDASAPDDWRIGLFGAFAYAFVAVTKGEGWRFWLYHARLMAAIPIVTAFFFWIFRYMGQFGNVVFAGAIFISIVASSVLAYSGLISGYMSISSRSGANESIEDPQTDVMGFMFPAAIEIFKANMFLTILPLALVLFASAVGGMFVATVFGGSSALAQFGMFFATVIYYGLWIVCTFCGPMCIMLLGSEDPESAYDPPKVLRMVKKTFLQYLLFYAYILLSVVMTYLLGVLLALIVGGMFGTLVAVASSGSILQSVLLYLAGAMSWIVISLVATYFAAMMSWSMGVFIFRNHETFDEVLESPG